MEISESMRTVTGSVQTSLPGVIFGSTLQRLAGCADRLTVVRSFQTNNAAHNIEPLVGPDSLQANIGCSFSSVAGTMRPVTGMPTNLVLFNNAVCDNVLPGRARGNISATGPFSPSCAPFIPGSGGQLQSDMQLNMPLASLEERQALLSEFDQLQEQFEAADLNQMSELQRQAFELLLSGAVAEALDLSREDPRVVDAYDTSRFVQPQGWTVRRSDQYTGHIRSLGRLLLLARRLCEAGAGFVTIHACYDGVWDMHADSNNLNMVDGMEAVGRCFDHAVAAFVEDLEARGLTDDILLVATGEMGRTPRINNNGGRDHWPRLAPLLLYGGGIRGGQVIGQSTHDGGEPATTNLTPRHLISTILRTVFHHGVLRVTPGIPQVIQLSENDPIPGLY
jgi:hypothetical protein